MKNFELEQCIAWQKQALELVTEDMPIMLGVLIEDVLDELEEEQERRQQVQQA